jgi:hypothetical protein
MIGGNAFGLLLSRLGGLASGLASDLDPDAQAYITAVETADAQALEPAVKTAINNFVVGCKADGIWNALKASCIMAGARTLAGALVPLKGTAPTNFNFVSGDYNRTTGLVGNGTTKYLNSNRNNNADPQNSRHLSVYTSALPAVGSYHWLIGTNPLNSSASTWLVNDRRTGAGIQFGFFNWSYPADYRGVASIGFIGGSRPSSSLVNARAASTNYTLERESSIPLNTSLLVFAGGAEYSSCRLAFYSIGESLNLAQLDARVTTLVNHLAFAINTGLNPTNYDADTIAYVNAGYAAGGTLA